MKKVMQTPRVIAAAMTNKDTMPTVWVTAVALILLYMVIAI